jgi:hypothetical protein
MRPVKSAKGVYFLDEYASAVADNIEQFLKDKCKQLLPNARR